MDENVLKWYHKLLMGKCSWLIKILPLVHILIWWNWFNFFKPVPHTKGNQDKKIRNTSVQIVSWLPLVYGTSSTFSSQFHILKVIRTRKIWIRSIFLGRRFSNPVATLINSIQTNIAFNKIFKSLLLIIPLYYLIIIIILV